MRPSSRADYPDRTSGLRFETNELSARRRWGLLPAGLDEAGNA